MPPKTSYQKKRRRKSPFDRQRNLEVDDSSQWTQIEKTKSKNIGTEIKYIASLSCMMMSLVWFAALLISILSVLTGLSSVSINHILYMVSYALGFYVFYYILSKN